MSCVPVEDVRQMIKSLPSVCVRSLYSSCQLEQPKPQNQPGYAPQDCLGVFPPQTSITFDNLIGIQRGDKVSFLYPILDSNSLGINKPSFRGSNGLP